MNTLTEDLEKILVIQETNQISKINQIYTKINELLQEISKKDQTIVKINISNLNKIDIHILEAIFSEYNAEIIEKELFIKYNEGNKKGIQLHFSISAMMHNQTWWVTQNQTCGFMGNTFQPNIGVWFKMPTFLQRQKPLIYICPLPNIWIELFYNKNSDYTNVLCKLNLIQQYNLKIEFIGICLPNSETPYHQNSTLKIASTPATPANPNVKPTQAPYFIYWNDNNIVYYNINWNKHLVLKSGWILKFNNIFDIISMP